MRHPPRPRASLRFQVSAMMREQEPGPAVAAMAKTSPVESPAAITLSAAYHRVKRFGPPST